ncbi:T9SS type A sorting domain-containing protein [Vicingus serpentipes]|uniref:T9SS type A sorting domain-containing protein n=1 Tax=Vicingus serpentipes TaxID=1926625 RepID=A0A5C6RZS6_9FLAO|nr:T9SS type A sorting domain-containing protein [Vicingus serpentipes]TXB66872.1 T9SS type A sorting domain-containing protein [Vicingus serpentipes]
MKKIYSLATALLIFSGYQAIAQCDGRYQADIFTNVDVTTVQYGSNQNLNGTTINLDMDIYQPQGDTASNRPVIIFAHGGSFSAGTKNDADQVFFATEMAKKGYVCASINYRLATSAFSLIAEETTAKVVLMAIQDGRAAIRFFKQDAATTNTYKVNPEQIFIGGTSAGGILGINLTYNDDISELSPQWQTWATEVGGIEGNSGNPGYCSRSNGTFGFAGGVADTSWIEENDVPWYGSHAYTDNTVQYGYGQPLNGFTPVFLYGSGLMKDRLNNLGIYNHLDEYTGGNHPPFAGDANIMANNKDSLAMFLYNILDCNPSNLQLPNQKSCNTTVSIAEVNGNTLDASIYPNPFNDEINVSIKEVNGTTISVINSLGKVVLTEQANSYITNINLSHLAKGVYIVKVNSVDGSNHTQLVVKQ